MQNAFIETLRNASTPNYLKMQELNEIGARTVRRLAEIQYKFVAIGIDGTVGQAKLLTSSPGYTELMQAQSQLATEYGSRLMAISRDAANVLVESRDEWMAWMKKDLSPVATPAKEKPQGKPKAPQRATKRRSA